MLTLHRALRRMAGLVFPFGFLGAGGRLSKPRRGRLFIVKNVTVEVNVVPHGDGGAPDLNGPLHGSKDGWSRSAH